MIARLIPRSAGGVLAVTAALFCGVDAALAETPAHETIIFVRHGEKPEAGLGQLNCQGLNRALALPAVIEAKFGKPTAVFAPDPSKRKNDSGKPYDYVRPLATVEPSAITFGLPVDTTYGFTELDGLKSALEQPAYRDATILVGWEHKLIDDVVKMLLAGNGGTGDHVPEWNSADFDGIYVVRITRTAAGSQAVFEKGTQGLNGQSTTCPK